MAKKVYKCSKCNKTFPSRDELRIHIFNEHLYPESKSVPGTFTDEQIRQMAPMEVEE